MHLKHYKPVPSLIGQKFNQLTVVRFSGYDSQSAFMFQCLCSCGNTIVLRASTIRNKRCIACAICGRKKATEALRTHGLSGTRFYVLWTSIKQRCTNPKSRSYEIYGGRGITLCDEWMKFENFYRDVFPLYVEGLEIDRIDNNLGYKPGNVRFVTHSE